MNLESKLDLKEIEKGKFVKVTGWENSKKAEKIISEGIERYGQKI